MVVVMLPGAAPQDVDAVVARVTAAGGSAFVSRGVERTIVGLVGDIAHFSTLNLRAMPGVGEVVRVSKPYKLVSREHHPQATTVTVGTGEHAVRIGPESFVLIAGPCAVESREQTFAAADMAKAAGRTVLRGGAYKPRTSPYAFQGLGVEGW
jgi:3-deoxy-7-phosphoheptulonate synthase